MPAAQGLDVLETVAAAKPRRSLSPVARRLRQQALDLAAAEGLGQGAFCFHILPLDGVDGEVLCVAGERLAAAKLLPASGTLTALACGVGTLGTGLEQRAAELFGLGRRSLALALDSLGNELLFAVSQRMRHRMAAEAGRQGLSMAGELRAGDPGLALEAQGAVLRLADSRRIGVHLTDGAMMHPVKSTSVIFGVGLSLAEVDWSRCDNCKSAAKCGFVAEPALGA